jgi:hypothetical protein
MEHKKDTIVIDHTKSQSYLHRQKYGVSSAPVTSSAKPEDKLARATAAAETARSETALRESKRSQASSTSGGGETTEKNGGRDRDGGRYDEGSEDRHWEKNEEVDEKAGN